MAGAVFDERFYEVLATQSVEGSQVVYGVRNPVVLAESQYLFDLSNAHLMPVGDAPAITEEVRGLPEGGDAVITISPLASAYLNPSDGNHAPWGLEIAVHGEGPEDSRYPVLDRVPVVVRIIAERIAPEMELYISLIGPDGKVVVMQPGKATPLYDIERENREYREVIVPQSMICGTDIVFSRQSLLP